jgi:hypothetical protein
MKKTTILMTVLLLIAWAGSIFWAAWELRSAFAPRSIVAQRVSQQDEDAAPAPEPAVALLVNGQPEATVVSGGPLYLTVSATGRHAVNVEAKVQLLRRRAERLAGQAKRSAADEQALPRVRAAIAALEAASRLTLGDAAHSWTEAVQVKLRPLAGGGAAPWALRTLASPGAAGPGTAAVLDAQNSVEAQMVPASAAPAAGDYEAQACLGATGQWKGTACSEPVRISVVAEMGLTAVQRDELDRQAARAALLTGDWAELQRRGQALLARDKVAGHTALGDAFFGQQRWAQALEHYTSARAAYPRRNGVEAPHALNLRISRLLEILETEQ